MRRPFRLSNRSPFRPGMDTDEFEKLVEEALAEIPRSFRKLIDNVAVLVEEESPEGRRLLGLYHGVPYQYRSPAVYGNISPDVIVIYKRPIEEISRTPEEIKQQVKLTVLHEVGHYFGLNESELRDIEAEILSGRRDREK